MSETSERRRQHGYALLSVLVLSLVFTLLALTFIALMNRDQHAAGETYRGTAAFYLADAGVQRILWLLAHHQNGAAPYPQKVSAGYQEELGGGRFVLEAIRDDDGIIALDLRGEVGATARRIRATARIASKALGFGLHAGDALMLTGQSRTYVVPCLEPSRACRQLGDVAAWRDVLLEKETALNALDGRTLPLRNGGLPDFALFGLSSAWADLGAREMMPALAITGPGGVSLGSDDSPLNDLGALQRACPNVHVQGLRADQAATPVVDLERYAVLATANRENRSLNRAAGERLFDRALREKQDSYYTPEQFERVLSHINARREPGQEAPALRGVIFVEGIVGVSGRLLIVDGALVVRGAISLMERASLHVRHASGVAGLPGVIAFGDSGMIRLHKESFAAVDGLLLASSGIEVLNATLEVAGAVVAGQGFVNDDGLAVIRYQPSVLATIGLSRTEHVLIRLLSWQELR